MNKLNADESVLKAMETLKNNEKSIGILLENCYKHEMFQEDGIEALEGIDKERYNFLQSVNERFAADERFEFNVAHLRLTVEYQDENDHPRHCNDDQDFQVSSRETEVVEWFDADGKSMGELQEIEFNSKLFDYVIDVTRARVLRDRDFDKDKTFGSMDVNEDFDGNPKFNDCTMTTVANRYLMILVPKKSKFELYYKVDSSLAIEHLKVISETLSVEKLRDRLRKCMANIGEKRFFDSPPSISEASLATILQLLPKANDLALVKLFLSKNVKIGEGMIKPFAKAIARTAGISLRIRWSVSLKQTILIN